MATRCRGGRGVVREKAVWLQVPPCFEDTSSKLLHHVCSLEQMYKNPREKSQIKLISNTLFARVSPRHDVCLEES